MRIVRQLASTMNNACPPRVGDLPIRPLPVIPAHLSMGAARKIAALKRAAVLLVERDTRLVGTLDERALAEAPDDAAVVASMRPLALCLHATTPAERALSLFIRQRTSALPVVAGGFLIGAVLRGDVESALRRRATPKRAHRSPVQAVA